MIESLTYLGPMGTFSEQAANIYAKLHAINDFVPMRTITEVGNYVIKNTSSSHNINALDNRFSKCSSNLYKRRNLSSSFGE